MSINTYLIIYSISICLSPYRLLKQNNIDWVAYKQQKFIFHSSGGQEVQDQGTGRFSVLLPGS